MLVHYTLCNFQNFYKEIYKWYSILQKISLLKKSATNYSGILPNSFKQAHTWKGSGKLTIKHIGAVSIKQSSLAIETLFDYKCQSSINTIESMIFDKALHNTKG